VQFSVRGETPGITGLRAKVSAPDGIRVTYPADKRSAGLSQDGRLGVLETDYVAFDIHVNNTVQPGAYNLTIAMSYGNGQQQTAVVPLTVT
jgi:hypothetical protein